MSPVSFLGAVSDFAENAPVDRTALRLRQRTARRLFTALPAELGDPKANLDLELFLSDSMAIEAPDTSVEASAAMARRDLDALAQGVVPPAVVDMLRATFEHPEGLRAYVARTAEGELADRERIYQRLKKQRTRALARLRLKAADELIEQRRAAAGGASEPRVCRAS